MLLLIFESLFGSRLFIYALISTHIENSIANYISSIESEKLPLKQKCDDILWM